MSRRTAYAIDADLESGRHDRVVTRFPPEPNGYLHVGHAKSICLNFGLARDFGGVCHMRFDDTNPEKEEQEYVDAILESVKWLGFDWKAFGTDHLYFASDYFDVMYAAAEYLILTGAAYVDGPGGRSGAGGESPANRAAAPH
jgi:glutaminyl-tRNA synthetase